MMDRSLIIIFYFIAIIIVLCYCSKSDNLTSDDNIRDVVENTLFNNTPITGPSIELQIESDIDTYKKLQDRRHAMILEHINRQSVTNSHIMENQNYLLNNTSTTIVNGTTVNDANQTFRQLLTEHPHRFNKGSIQNYSTRIEIVWNFDRILPSYDNTDVTAALNFLNIDSSGNYGNSLPYIKYIKVQIYSESNWINIPAVLLEPDSPALTYSDTNGIIVNGNISNNESKNLTILRSGVGSPSGLTGELTQDAYDQLNGTNPITLRIYGVNNAPTGAPPVLNDSNITQDDERVLIYSASFSVGQPSTDPVLQSASLSNQDIFIILQVSQTEIGDDSSPARISQVSVKYKEYETTGYNITLSPSEQTQTTSLNPVVNKDTNFTTNLSSLKYGMKYETSFSALNTLSANSDFTTFSPQRYSTSGDIIITDPPDNTKNVTINIATTNTPNKSIISPTVGAQSIVYFNVPIGTLNYSSTSLQNFSVSNPFDTPNIVSGQFKGIGNNISNVSELVKITQVVDSSEIMSATYGGWANGASVSGSSGTIGSVSQSEALSGDSIGFRIQGNIQLSNYDINGLSSSSSIRSFKTSFSRNATYSDYSTNLYTNTLTFIIDNLTGAPDISNTSVVYSTNEVIYTMGIPSVKSINLMPDDRTYSNINSSHNFMNSNLTVSNFSFTGGNTSNFGISTSTRSYVLNNTPEIKSNGQYFSTTQFDFANQTVANSITNPLIDSTLNYRDTAYNLITSTQVDNSLTFKLHSDRSSYDSNFNRNFPSEVYTMDSTNLLNKLQTDPTNSISEYVTHTNIPNTYTMLFYKNTFNVNTGTYPDQVDQSYFNDLVLQYYGGTDGMNLSLPTNSTAAESGNGTTADYKMIVFRITNLTSECSSLADYDVTSIKSVRLDTYLQNKKVDSTIISECNTLYSDSFCLVYAKYNGNWAIGSPAVNYSSFSSAWWNRGYIQSSGDTTLEDYYQDNFIIGCRNASNQVLSLVYEQSGTGIDLSEDIYVIVASKI